VKIYQELRHDNYLRNVARIAMYSKWSLFNYYLL